MGQKALFAGGVGPGLLLPSNVVDIYDGTTHLWSTTTLPGVIAVNGNRVPGVGVGGKGLFVTGRTVYIYDTRRGTWTTATLSQTRTNAAAAGNRAIFVGRDRSSSSTADVYDAGTGKWSIESIPLALRYNNAATAGNLALFHDHSSPNNHAVDIYNGATDQWSVGHFDGDPIVAVGTQVIFWTDTSNRVRTGFNVYDTVSGKSSALKLPAGLPPLFPDSATAVGTKAILPGGSSSSGANGSLVMVYDTATGAWSTAAPISIQRDFLAPATVGTTAMFASGLKELIDPLDTVDIYTDLTPAPVLSGSITTRRHRDSANVTITNSGDAAFAGGYTVKVYAARSSTLGDDSVLVGTVTLRQPLVAGASLRMVVPTSFTSVAQSGTYHLIAAVIDAQKHQTPIASAMKTFQVQAARYGHTG